MPKTPPMYQRLTRRTASVTSYRNLWLAADHIMILNSNGYTEEYQRVRLRDIKGFFVVASGRRTYWSLPWGAFALVSGLILIHGLWNHDTPVIVTSSIFFGLTVMALVWNYLLGEGCRTYVVTGVQTALLPSLVRRPKTRKVLDRLGPLVVAAQADLIQPAAALSSSPATEPLP